MQTSEDLFAEVFEERAAIHEHEGGLDRETSERMAAASTEAYRHACEINSVVRMYRQDGGEAVKDFLTKVAKHRGQSAADRLRTDALKELRGK